MTLGAGSAGSAGCASARRCDASIGTASNRSSAAAYPPPEVTKNIVAATRATKIPPVRVRLSRSQAHKIGLLQRAERLKYILCPECIMHSSCRTGSTLRFSHADLSRYSISHIARNFLFGRTDAYLIRRDSPRFVGSLQPNHGPTKTDGDTCVSGKTDVGYVGRYSGWNP